MLVEGADEVVLNELPMVNLPTRGKQGRGLMDP